MQIRTPSHQIDIQPEPALEEALADAKRVASKFAVLGLDLGKQALEQAGEGLRAAREQVEQARERIEPQKRSFFSGR